MFWLSMLIAAVAPGLALLVYFYLKDQHMTEPIHLVAKVFVIGIFIVFPTMIIQRGLYLWFSPPDWVMSFVLAAGVEEFVKWFILLYYIANHKEFDEPYDGIVYATAVSLGYATMENVIYAWSYELGPMSFILRALFPVSGHALFGVMMGFYLGKSKFSIQKSRLWLIFSWLSPVFWHGIFDYLLTHSDKEWIGLLVPFMVLLWILALRHVKVSNHRSPYRPFHQESL